MPQLPTRRPAPVPAGGDRVPDTPTVVARGTTRRFGPPDRGVLAVAGIDLTLRPGTFVAVIGPSGSGKSTLLHLLAGLDRPTAGTVEVDGLDLGGLDDEALTALRRDRMGFVLQDASLVPVLSVTENIDLPLSLGLDPSRVDRAWRDHLVRALGLSGLLERRPGELSGGQQQRVAVARALAHRPRVVFADEPTGNLDLSGGRRLLDLLRDLAARHGTTVVMVTHDVVAAARADRVLVLADGALRHDLSPSSPEQLARLVIAAEVEAGGDA